MWKIVNRFDRTIRVNENGKVQRQSRSGEWITMKPHEKDGRYVGFYPYKHGVPTSISANRLIYEAFHGPLENGKRVVNIDGNRLNFKLENLKVIQRAEKAPYERVRPRIEQIAPDGSVIAVFDTMVQAAEATYCDKGTVSNHCRGVPADPFKTMGFSFRYEEVKK